MLKNSSHNKIASKEGSPDLSWSRSVDRFATHLDQSERSRLTVAGYRSELEAFRAWYQETIKEEPTAASITASDLLEWKRTLMGRELKPASINRKLSAARSFLAWAERSGLIAAMPQTPRQQRHTPLEVKWLDRREQLALVRVVERAGNVRDLALVHVLIHTGLRASELVALAWKDLEISDRKGSLTVRMGKGAKWRQIPLNATARESFKTLGYQEQKGSALAVFRGQRGPMSRRGVDHILAHYAAAAGVEVSAHTLRHTFCKNLIDSGVGLVEVARLAGHESITTTQRYVTPSAADLERAVEIGTASER